MSQDLRAVHCTTSRPAVQTMRLNLGGPYIGPRCNSPREFCLMSANKLEAARLDVHSVAFAGAKARPAPHTLVRRRKTTHTAPLARRAVLRRPHSRARVHYLRLLGWPSLCTQHPICSALYTCLFSAATNGSWRPFACMVESAVFVACQMK